MDDLLNWLWQGSVVALALSVSLRALGRARANVRYGVCWAALLLVLGLPFLNAVESGAALHPSIGVPSDAVVSVPTAWWTSGALIVAAWVAWAAAQCVTFVRAMAALQGARANARPFPPEVESQLPHWQVLRGRRRRAGLMLSDRVTAAAVLGCGRPMIAVAPSLVASLDADELDRVLIHEWAHVQRRDDLVAIGLLVVRLVAGWHPAVWWIDRRLHVERETACDELTVAIAGSPRSYAASLLKLATLRGVRRETLAAPAALAGSSLRARITRILSPHERLAPGWASSIAAASVITLAGATVMLGGFSLVGSGTLAAPLESRVGLPAPARPEPVGAEAALSRSARAGESTGHRAATRSAHQPIVGDASAAARQVRRPLDSADDVASTVGGGGRTGTVPAPAVGASSPAPLIITDNVAADVASLLPDRVTPPVPAEPAPAPAAATAPAPAAATAETPSAGADSMRSPWAKATDGGMAIGRESKAAGVATGRFFNRLARRVAGSVTDRVH